MRGDRPCKKGLHYSVNQFTPHARGSTPRAQEPRAQEPVYPACAGIDRSWCTSSLILSCLPRMRGDRPMKKERLIRKEVFTPHARGSTFLLIVFWWPLIVYPACAGIDPCGNHVFFYVFCLPRMRGDRPRLHRLQKRWVRFTPHARGSTQKSEGGIDMVKVYPACAGIDPYICYLRGRSLGLPRMRGDRPGAVGGGEHEVRFTPHARGSTVHLWLDVVSDYVYPACAGIDRCGLVGYALKGGLPRMRGDRPRSMVVSTSAPGFTPHARGSTYIGGCVYCATCVYPACAGIDPRRRSWRFFRCSLPRMRGDRPVSSF